MKCIVLRDVQRGRTTDPFGGPGGLVLAAPTASDPPPEPRLDVEDLTARDRGDLSRDPAVVAITATMRTALIAPVATAEESGTGDAWGIAAVGADKTTATGAGTTVAVLDTGVDAAHPAFQGVTVVAEDFTGSGNPGDEHGHGTHCAGTILGRDVGGRRIGVARGVDRLLAGKVLADSGGGDSEMIFRGIQWAAANGAQVISMSLGFDFPGHVAAEEARGVPPQIATSMALEAYRGNLRMFDALMAMMRAQAAFSGGAVVVAASGNECRRDDDPTFEIAASLPAAADGVVSVGAIGPSPKGYLVAPFSNTFPSVCAPGVDILSARPGGGLATMSGTSMACPHVAGVAALWWQRIGDYGPKRSATVLARLIAGCRLDPLAHEVDPNDRGNGLVTAP